MMVIPCLGLPSESEGESEEVIDASDFCPSIVSEGVSQVRGSLPFEEAIDMAGDLSVELSIDDGDSSSWFAFGIRGRKRRSNECKLSEACDFCSSTKQSGETTKSSLRRTNFHPNVVSEGASKRGSLPLVSEEVSRVREGAFHQRKLTTR